MFDRSSIKKVFFPVAVGTSGALTIRLFIIAFIPFGDTLQGTLGNAFVMLMWLAVTIGLYNKMEESQED